ncbi:hypothetical protein JTE90_003093 [Oedothorax gibbosus]|nr:hypothetical protein JTE90_003093 [Oedothorax gibbosus]
MQSQVEPPLNRTEKDSLCNYTKIMETRNLVNERSLCPFYWNVSSKNTARIPEVLYVAQCACYTPKGIGGARCEEFKTKVQVVWKIGCEGGKYVYKEGWEYISVACYPVMPEKIKTRPLTQFEKPSVT